MTTLSLSSLGTSFGGKLLTILFSLLLIAPTLLLVIPAFNFGHISNVDLEQTTQAYLIPNKLLVEYIINTLLLMLGVGILVTFFGVGSACLVTFFQFPGRDLLKYLLFFPLAIPAYITAFSYTYTFEFASPLYTFVREDFGIYLPQIKNIWGAIFIMSLAFYPYIYMFTLTRIGSLGNFVAVSRCCGRSAFYTMLHVVIPLSRPAIMAGLALVLMEVLADFGVAQFFSISTFTTGIYRSWFLLHNNIVAGKLIFILLIFTVALLLAEKAARNKRNYNNNLGNNLNIYWQLKGYKSLGTIICLSFLPFFGFVLPLTPLFFWAFNKGIDYKALNLIIDTFNIALIASFITVSISILILYLIYRDRAKPASRSRGWPRFTFAHILGYISNLGYAIPSIIVAIGILNFLGQGVSLFNSVSEFIFGNIFGDKFKLIIIGTFFALIYSYVFRFLALSNNSLEIGMKKIPQELHWNLQLMDKNSFLEVVKAYYPMLIRNVCSALILVFIDIIKELPATLVVRPFNFETLSTRIYELIMDERYKEAAFPSLMITLVGVLSIIFLIKMLYAKNLHSQNNTVKINNCICDVCLNIKNECYN